MPRSKNGSGEELEETGQRLDSWKEIAAYLKREIRTIQRWEKTQGLPVYRHIHNKAATVYAYKSELDTWWHSGHEQLAAEPARRWHWIIPLSLACLLLIAVSATWRYARTTSAKSNMLPPPAIAGRLLAISTAEEHPFVWIPVGKSPARAAITPSGSEIYVSDRLDGTVSVIDTAANSVTHKLPVGKRPDKVMVSADGRRVYVTTQLGGLYGIDTRTKAVSLLEAGTSITDVAVTGDGARLYVAEPVRGLSVQTISKHKIETIPTTAAPFYLALTPDGSRLYVNYQNGGPGGRPGHDAIDVFDTSQKRFIANINGPPNVGGDLAISPDGRQVWASGLDACRSPAYDHTGCPKSPGQASIINVIRTSDNQLVQTLGFEQMAGNPVSFFPDGSRAIIGGRPLQVIDTATFGTVEAIDIQGTDALFTPDAARAYVVVPERSAVLMIELSRPPCAAPPPGLVAWWTGDGTANDARGSNHGKLAGGARFAPGRVGQAFLLGGHAFVDVGKLANLNGIATAEYTFAAWVKWERAPGTAAAMPILDRMTYRGGLPLRWQLFKKSDGHMMFCVATGAAGAGCSSGSQIAATSRTVAEPGKWVHIAVTKTETNIDLYLNGVRESSSPVSLSRDPELPGEVRIGAGVLGDMFLNGLVDEAQWFNRSLSANEIKSIFLASEAGLCYHDTAVRN